MEAPDKLAVARIRESAAAGTRYPADLDVLWGLLKFATKRSAKVVLEKDGFEGEILWGQPALTGGKGRPLERILLTVRGFKLLCGRAPHAYGRRVWEYYVELAQAPPVSALGPVPPLVPPVSATPLVLGDDKKLELKRFHEEIRKAEAAGTQYPVDFDHIWEWMYARKDSAKRALKGPGIDGEIILHTPVEVTTPNNSGSKWGPAPETILMTVKAFKHFCLKAPGTLGAQIREYYISLEEIAHAAIAVAQDVATGDVTVTATSADSLKRLRRLEGAVESTSKKMRLFTTQEVDNNRLAVLHGEDLAACQKRFDDQMAHAQAVHQKRVAHYGKLRDDSLEAATAAKAELELQQRRHNIHLRELTGLKETMEASDATYEDMKAGLRAKMDAEEQAWLREQEAKGTVFSEKMVLALGSPL